MCSCVSGEVLRQCSAANPADIYVRSMTVIYRLKQITFYINFHACIDTADGTPMCILY